MKLEILNFSTDGANAEIKCDVPCMDLETAIADLNKIAPATNHLIIKSMKIVFEHPGL